MRDLQVQEEEEEEERKQLEQPQAATVHWYDNYSAQMLEMMSRVPRYVFPNSTPPD
jgi:hypothetical protein